MDLDGANDVDISPPMLAGITLTGADEHTDLDALVALAKRNPELEIGLLYTDRPEGRPRYPSFGWLSEVIRHRLPGRCALHVCGRAAREKYLGGELGVLLHDVRRVQINGHVMPDEVMPLAMEFPILIMQWRPGRDSHDFEDAVIDARRSVGLCQQWLVDGSGGRGLLPEKWSRPPVTRPVGFAGGLGPETLALQLPRIAAVAESPWWIDMENALRTHDWFDLDKCRAVLHGVAEWRANAGTRRECAA